MNAETLLFVDASTLETRLGGPAIADIWLVSGNSAFPSLGWTDFVVVVLGRWAAAIVRILPKDGSSKRIHFMDGPFVVEVCKTSSSLLQFRMLECRDRDREVGNGEAALKPFILRLTSQSRKVLAACRSQAWWSADADALDSLTGELERVALRL